jgi:hypothetical protein
LREKLKKERKIVTGNSEFTQNLAELSGEQHVESLLYVDKIFVNAKNWQRVVDSYPDLRLCLAHFGGYSSWVPKSRQQKEAEDAARARGQKVREKPDWRQDVAALVTGSKHVYTDISCFLNITDDTPSLLFFTQYYDMIKKIKNKSDAGFVEGCYRQSMNLMYYMRKKLSPADKRHLKRILMEAEVIGYDGLDKHDKETGFVGDELYHVGSRLAEFINSHPKKDLLKKRIMMGSDWPMFETTFSGVGEYYDRMFEILKIVTKKSSPKFDAWHQFAVLNPLRFLGILDDNDEIVMSKLEDHKKAIEKQFENKAWLKTAKVTERKDALLKKAQEVIDKYKRFQRIKIKKAEEIVGKGGADDFIILKDEENV